MSATARRLGVLVSGSGTNLQAILDATAAGSLDAEVALVISNRADAPALGRAERARVPSQVVPHAAFADRGDFDARLAELLQQARVDWVVLAGFMRVLGPRFLGAFPARVVNLHPSLLPAFPGAHALRDALAYGVKVTGCTVHLVDDGVDTGPILAQRAVPVEDGDDLPSLAARVRACEHELLVATLSRLVRDGVVLEPSPGARLRVRFGP